MEASPSLPKDSVWGGSPLGDRFPPGIASPVKCRVSCPNWWATATPPRPSPLHLPSHQPWDRAPPARDTGVGCNLPVSPWTRGVGAPTGELKTGLPTEDCSRNPFHSSHWELRAILCLEPSFHVAPAQDRLLPPWIWAARAWLPPGMRQTRSNKKKGLLVRTAEGIVLHLCGALLSHGALFGHRDGRIRD